MRVDPVTGTSLLVSSSIVDHLHRGGLLVFWLGHQLCEGSRPRSGNRGSETVLFPDSRFFLG